MSPELTAPTAFALQTAEALGLDCVVFDVAPGVLPSGRPPVRIFVGSEEAQQRAERVLLYSVRKFRDPARVYRVHLMHRPVAGQGARRPAGTAASHAAGRRGARSVGGGVAAGAQLAVRTDRGGRHVAMLGLRRATRARSVGGSLLVATGCRLLRRGEELPR